MEDFRCFFLSLSDDIVLLCLAMFVLLIGCFGGDGGGDGGGGGGGGTDA